MRFFTFFISLFFLLPAFSQAKPVDAKASSIEFISRQMGVPIKGSFKRFDADISFDEKRPEKSVASITIYLDNTDAGSDDATVEVKRKPWFNTKEHPKAQFKTSSIIAVNKGEYRVSGVLTIKGRAREVIAPTKVAKIKEGRLFEGRFFIKRLDFSIGEGAWSDIETVADDVEVIFRLMLPEDR